MIKLQADTIDGVYEVESFEGDTVSQVDFYDSLYSLRDGETICAEVDAETAAIIFTEYGYTWL